MVVNILFLEVMCFKKVTRKAILKTWEEAIDCGIRYTNYSFKVRVYVEAIYWKTFLGKEKVKFNIDSSIPYLSHPYDDDEYQANRLMHAKAKELGFEARMWVYEHRGEFEHEAIKLRHQTLK